MISGQIRHRLSVHDFGVLLQTVLAILTESVWHTKSRFGMPYIKEAMNYLEDRRSVSFDAAA